MNIPYSRRSLSGAGFFGTLVLAASLWVGCQSDPDATGPSNQPNTVKNSSVASKCSDVNAPVCGANGVSYLNSCAAQMLGETEVASQGICPGKPLDGWTSVESGEDSVRIAIVGPDSIRCGTPDPEGPDPLTGISQAPADPEPIDDLDPTCKAVFPADIAIKCADTLDPVCGCDGKTYRNSCYANGVGHVYAKSKGACPGLPYVEE